MAWMQAIVAIATVTGTKVREEVHLPSPSSLSLESPSLKPVSKRVWET